MEQKFRNKKLTLEKPIEKDFEQFFTKVRSNFTDLCIDGETELRSDSLGVSINLSQLTKYQAVKYQEWTPLVNKDKHLINSVLLVPSRKNLLDYCDKVSLSQINDLEYQLFKIRKINNEKKGIETEDLYYIPDLCPNVLPLLLEYKDGSEFKKTFNPLIDKERAYEYLNHEDYMKSNALYNRTKDALDSFETNQNLLNDEIYETILGKKISTKTDDLKNCPINDSEILALSAPNLSRVNKSQANAIMHGIKYPLTLIQGPPGTGIVEFIIYLNNLI